MSLEVPEPIVSHEFIKDVSANIIYEEIMHTEGFKSLSPEQMSWFEYYAAPLLTDAGIETGQAIARELADEGETREQRVSREAEIFVRGIEDMRDYLGR